MKVYLRYQDDGPSGFCGQTTSVTSPWDQLHIFPDYDSAREYMRQLEQWPPGRKNPRVTAIWQEESGLEVFNHIGSDQDLPARLRELAASHMEQIAAEVHNQWWMEKEKQGFHPPTQCQYWPLPHGKEESKDAAFNKHCDKCHPDMYPYKELPEHIKEYDRVTVRGVLSAIERIAAELEKEE